MPGLNPQFRVPAIFEAFPELVAVESTRIGGVSPQPFESLNLGQHTEDDPLNVQTNMENFAYAAGFDPLKLAISYQVHGDKIYLAEKPGQVMGYDALITRERNLFISVKTADCLPILLFDPENLAVAAIHAGWKGTVLGIVAKTVDKMKKDFNTQAKNLLAYLGACICECSFEVDADVADHFDGNLKLWNAKKGKYFVDLKKANANQLLKSGIPVENIEISSFSTVLHNDQYFSHRKEDGITGRMMSVIGFRV